MEQEERNRRIQVDITEDAHTRLRIEAARLEVSIGAVISWLAKAHLASAPEPKAGSNA